MPRILIVEDDPGVRDVVEYALSREGMDTVTTVDGENALKCLLDAGTFDLLVLDVMLPGMDGVSLCREIRGGDAGSVNKNIPIIMLTARNDETSVVVGLEVGADDYVTKPFNPRELVSRVRAHLRRSSLNVKPEEQQRLEFPGLKIDLLRREVVSEGKPVNLTAREFEVIVFLAEKPGRIYSREQIMRHLYAGDFFGEARAADVHIQHIRQKIEPDPQNPRYIQTIRSVGYRFADL